MDKLNKLGNEILDYKNELNKNYPDLVKKSLEQSINILAENGVIDVDILYGLTHDEVSKDDLEELLFNKPSCVKSNSELLVEYDAIKKVLDDILQVTGNDDCDIKTISDVEEGNIIIAKNFIYGYEFAKEYFDIYDEQILKNLMNRQGTFEKFAVLRLGKVMKDFVKKQKENTHNFEITFSETFYDNNKEAYGISLIFKVPIEELEGDIDNYDECDDCSNIESITDIQNIIDESTKYFNMKMKP